MKTETLLLEMRKEQREDHQTLLATVSEGFTAAAAAMAAHTLEDTKAFGALDKRLAPVEEARKVYRKTALALVLAILPIGADACMHVAKYFKP